MSETLMIPSFRFTTALGSSLMTTLAIHGVALVACGGLASEVDGGQARGRQDGGRVADPDSASDGSVVYTIGPCADDPKARCTQIPIPLPFTSIVMDSS